MKRSPILEASRRYWHWLGGFLYKLTHRRQRRSRVFLFGGPFFWLFALFFLVFFGFFLLLLAVGALMWLLIIGGVLSGIGGLDQLRLNLFVNAKKPPTI